MTAGEAVIVARTLSVTGTVVLLPAPDRLSENVSGHG
jgi:hypothetical protein